MQTEVQSFDGVPVIGPNQAFTSLVSTPNLRLIVDMSRVAKQSP